MKKATCILIIAALLIALPFNANASNQEARTGSIRSTESPLVNTAQLAEIGRQLAFWMQCSESEYDTVNAAFSLGEPIRSYELINGQAIQTGISYIPIFYEDKLTCFAIVFDSPADSTVQLTGGLADKLGPFVGNTPVAFLYDSKNCYLVTHYDVQLLYENDHRIETRSTFESIADLSTSNLILTELYPSSEFDSDLITSTRSAISLPVSYVSQYIAPGVTSNICWAASTACIGNYLTTNYYTAIQVAQAVYGNTNYNQGAGIDDAVDTLASLYSIYYSYYDYSTPPTESRIYNNINAGYPLFGGCHYLSGDNVIGHMTVISGIDYGSYIYIMDPWFGFTIAQPYYGYYIYKFAGTNTDVLVTGYGAMI